MDIRTTHVIRLEDTETFLVTGYTTGLHPVTVRAKHVTHTVGSSRVETMGQRLLADGKSFSMGWVGCISTLEKHGFTQFPSEVRKALQIPDEDLDG